jgi:hypothetical protein
VNIEPIDNGNLRIWLAEDEIEAWGLAEEDTNGIRRLVRRALSAAGWRHTARTCAEMIPVEGGCVVLVSPYVHTRRLPMVYAVSGDDLVEVYRRYAGPPAQVYAVEDTYHVVLYEHEGETMMREYGTPLGYGEGIAARTAEYGQWLFTMPAPAPPAREGSGR